MNHPYSKSNWHGDHLPISPQLNSGIRRCTATALKSAALVAMLVWLAPISALATSPIINVTGSDALEGWGEHVVAYGNRLHMVFLSGGVVKYVTSADGQV